MGREEETPRFVPLVRDSAVVREDRPWLPDDIELVHEKHQRVIRSWEQQKLDEDEISLTVPSTPDVESFHDDEECEDLSEIYKTRRRTIILVTVFLVVCLAAIGTVFLTVRLVYSNERSPQATPSDSGGPITPPPPPPPPPSPSEAPTQKPSEQRPTDEHADSVGGETLTPTASPTLAPTNAPTRIYSETEAPVSSMQSETPAPTSMPTVEATFVPAISFGLDDDTAQPSNGPDDGITLWPSVVESMIQTTRRSRSPTMRPPYAAAEAPARTCNGLATNCNLRVNEVMFAAVHDAMSSVEDGFDGPSNSYHLEVSVNEIRLIS